VPEQLRHEINSKHEKRENQLESMLIKQGKQLRVLYELHKLTNEKLSWIQGQMKKQIKIQDTELSQKVFGVSIFIFKQESYNYRYFNYLSLHTIYRKDITPYVLDIFQQRCGLVSTNSNVVWKIGLEHTTRTI
jgi:hypothetical protein